MTDEFLSLVRERIRRLIHRNSPRCSNSRFDTSDVVQEALIQTWLEKGKHHVDSVPGSPDGKQDEPLQTSTELANEDHDKDRRKVSNVWLNIVSKGHLAKAFRHHFAGKRSLNKETTPDKNHDSESRAAGPVQQAEENEMTRLVLLAINDLDDLQRAIIRKRCFGGQSVTAVSAELGITEYRVKAETRAALAQLEESLNGK